MLSASLYDRLERALIALEYALGDARTAKADVFPGARDCVAKSQDALQSAGEEVQEALLALRAAALRDAAIRVMDWA